MAKRGERLGEALQICGEADEALVMFPVALHDLPNGSCWLGLITMLADADGVSQWRNLLCGVSVVMVDLGCIVVLVSR